MITKLLLNMMLDIISYHRKYHFVHYHTYFAVMNNAFRKTVDIKERESYVKVTRHSEKKSKFNENTPVRYARALLDTWLGWNRHSRKSNNCRGALPSGMYVTRVPFSSRKDISITSRRKSRGWIYLNEINSIEMCKRWSFLNFYLKKRFSSTR